ncbi:MAG: archease [Endomicrobiales bacterium]|nr:archease [Endomicrobiales bacterium]
MNKKKVKYSFISHTSDIGIKVYGESLKTLFENAAQGLCSYILAPVGTKLDFHDSIKIEGTDHESLLVNWLNEILYQAYQKKILITSFNVDKIEKTRMEAEIWGRKILEEYKINHEIKAVTYSNLKIKSRKSGYSVKIIFDV